LGVNPNVPSRAAPLPAAAMLGPLVLAQFLCSYAASNMNVAISDIAADLNTTVSGVQAAITVFTLTMAALMIPGGKLSDIWGRKTTFTLGLIVYGTGALVAAASTGLGVLMIGYSILQGVGTALLIPPVYVLATVFFSDTESRARAFGSISAAGGIGAAAGPLIGGLITSLLSWRVSFLVQAVLAVGIIVLSRRLAEPVRARAATTFDGLGAVLSAAGLFCIVVGILQTSTYGWFTAKQSLVIGDTVVIPQGGISPVWLFVLVGAVLLVWFFAHIRSMERAGRQPLLSTRMFKDRVANLGLTTQSVQWLVLLGLSFVVSVYLQTVRGFSAIETGLILTPATVGILVASMGAGRLAGRYTQAILIRSGFIVTLAGIVMLLLLANATSGVLGFVPGLLLVGLGVGVMLTSSVNVVQSSFPDEDQGEISGLSRSVSNLGSSLGVAIAGSVIVADLAGNQGYALALVVLAAFGCLGLLAAELLTTAPAQVADAPARTP
jgi:MFS family permease